MAYNRQKDIQLGKTLSWILRHGAMKEGLLISSDGFVNVNDILKNKNFVNKYTLDDIVRVVETNDKKRYTLWTDSSTKCLKIKARQGHSLTTVKSDCLEPILENSCEVIHGTYFKNWPSIKKNGLNRMTRNHIHFASGTPKNNKPVSGARKDCELFIYINLQRALCDGIKFFKSENNVILCPGNEQGVLDKIYFSKVVSAVDGKLIYLSYDISGCSESNFFYENERRFSYSE